MRRTRADEATQGRRARADFQRSPGRLNPGAVRARLIDLSNRIQGVPLPQLPSAVQGAFDDLVTSLTRVLAELERSVSVVDEAQTDVVSGPSSSTDNAVATWDGTTGKLLQESSWFATNKLGNIASPSADLEVAAVTPVVWVRALTNGSAVIRVDGVGTLRDSEFQLYYDGAEEGVLRYSKTNDAIEIEDDDAVAVSIQGGHMSGAVNPVSLTIASGAVALPAHDLPAAWAIQVDTEGAAATDDLDDITGAVAGDIVILHTADSTRDVTAKDGTALKLAGDFTMDVINDSMMLYARTSSVWVEISRSNNA